MNQEGRQVCPSRIRPIDDSFLSPFSSFNDDRSSSAVTELEPELVESTTE
jgi:hypothetical protein